MRSLVLVVALLCTVVAARNIKKSIFERQFPDDPSPVLMLPLNANDKMRDVTGRGNNGQGGPIPPKPRPKRPEDDDEFCSYYYFDGNKDSYIRIPNNGAYDAKDKITIAMHVRPGGQAGPLLTFDDEKGHTGVRIRDEMRGEKSNEIAEFTRRDMTPTPELVYELDQNHWNYIAATYDNSTRKAKLYINDTLVDSKDIGDIELATQFGTRVGPIDSQQNKYRGDIACMQIFDKALSRDQIHRNGRHPKCPRCPRDIPASTEEPITSNTAGPITPKPTEPITTKTAGPFTSNTDEPITTPNVAGDPHMRTFDGHPYSFQGVCWYTLVKDCSKAMPEFEITADFVPRDDLSDVTRTRALRINVNVNGENVLVDRDNVVTTSYNIQHISINKDDHRVVISFTLHDSEFKMEWVGRKHTFHIDFTGEHYKGKVCGLLGNHDGNSLNDFQKPDGTVTHDANEFGDSWKVVGKKC
ncbi:uncharacterized protein LOC100369643 [Saccoglossus kowalevskii]|uniref:Uncharacterized protein LOC100369643 n=1 Tax=Saccoglossus kowalevskii TaxID=10224 RepID=A0ABM0GZY7_SACKO|nr:PREDICTED: uncharacterized protein LOC100369643 [Saccoglossus kowalevskii]